MCSIFKTCCNLQNEEFWIEKPTYLLCSLNPIPKGGITSPKRLNAVTRGILYITVLLYFCKYNYWYLFLILGLFFVILLYYTTNKLSMSNTREYYSNIPNSTVLDSDSPIGDITSPNYLQTPLSLYTNTRSDMTKNVTNTTQGSTQNLVHKQSLNPSKAHRDEQAGIKYYTPNVGTNLRTHVPPVLGPRIYDQEVWGRSSVVRPRTNFQKIRDITESELQLPDLQGNSTSLGVPIVYQTQMPNSLVPQNQIQQPTYDGYYPSAEVDLHGGMDERDFKTDVLPNLYGPLNEEEEPLYEINEQMYESMFTPTEKNPMEMTLKDVQIEQQKRLQKEEQKKQKNNKENFRYLNNNTNNNNMNNQFVSNYPNNNTNSSPIPPQYMQNLQMQNRHDLNSINSAQANQALYNKFYNQGEIMQPNQYYDVMNRVPPGKDIQPHVVMDQLLPQSPTYVYTDQYFNNPTNRLFLQDVQPKLYSYSVEQQPINANIGITYAPQNPPPVLDQIRDNRLNMPIMTRVDPQLVRTDGTRAQQALQPTRTNWSAEYSNFVPPPGSINFEDIYDPRFTTYSDPWRSYSDVNLGQVQYYYSDVDAYRMPNFVTRSNVDFIEYRTPQGQIWPEYPRTASVDDVRSHVESQYTADDTYHREDLMSLQMAKANRIAWAQRHAPLRQRGANAQASTYGPGI